MPRVHSSPSLAENLHAKTSKFTERPLSICEPRWRLMALVLGARFWVASTEPETRSLRYATYLDQPQLPQVYLLTMVYMICCVGDRYYRERCDRPSHFQYLQRSLYRIQSSGDGEGVEGVGEEAFFVSLLGGTGSHIQVSLLERTCMKKKKKSY